MAKHQAKSSSLDLAPGVVLAKSDGGGKRELLYSNEEKTKVSRKKLMWCGIGLGAAIVIPLFVYFAPHLL